ncbi:MAG: AEC family transporter [Lentihominibacter sp.]|jgi:predicted permease
MEAILTNLSSLAMIFLIIIPGIIVGKMGLITEEQTEGLSFVVVNITFPCLLIDALQVEFTPQAINDLGLIAAIWVAVFFFALAMAFLIRKIPKVSKDQSYLIAFMICFANTGFMGMPIVNAIYGKEGLFYTGLIEFVNDILMFTVGIMFVQASAAALRNEGKDHDRYKMDLRGLLTPGFIGLMIGIILFLLSIDLPGFIGGAVTTVGSATTPLSMLVIGLLLSRMTVKEILGDYVMYIVSFIKLVALPLMGLIFFLVTQGELTLMAKVVIIELAMPAAMCTSIFAVQYKADAAYGTKGVMVTTLLSIITLSIFVVIMELF